MAEPLPRKYGRIVVVDDDHESGKNLTRHLSQVGYDVKYIDPKGKAYEDIKEDIENYQPDLVIADLHWTTLQNGEGYGLASARTSKKPTIVTCRELKDSEAATNLINSAGGFFINRNHGKSFIIEQVIEYLETGTLDQQVLNSFDPFNNTDSAVA